MRAPARIVSALLGLVLVAMLAVAPTAASDTSVNKQNDGKFTGIAMVTSDLKWFKLFESPKTPEIKGKDSFRPGEWGAIAVIFANAEPRKGVVKVECDITAFDPKGSTVILKGGKCYEGPYYGDFVLTPVLIDLHFEIKADDAPGRAGFKITLRDVYSKRSVKLTVDFQQDTGG
jgi:hypothetical protein